MALAGDVLAIGCIGDTELGQTRSGAVYIYRYDGSSWSQEAKILPDYAPSYSNLQFGEAVTLSGDVLAVGARGYRVNTNQEEGAGWVFRHGLCTNQIVATRDACTRLTV